MQGEPILGSADKLRHLLRRNCCKRGAPRLDGELRLWPAEEERVGFGHLALNKLSSLRPNKISAALHSSLEAEARLQVVLVQCCEDRERPEQKYVRIIH